jgi:hypothetical protein
MRALATGRVGHGGAPIVAAGLPDGDRERSITRSVAQGTLVVLTDTAMTEGCPGRPGSEDALLRSAELWMQRFGADLPCVVLQMGFDAAGRPRAVLALGDGTGRASGVMQDPDHGLCDGFGHADWECLDDTVEVKTLPCIVVTFTGSSEAEGASGSEDGEAALLRDVRSWICRNPDFVCEAVQMAHDPTGRPQAVLVGEGIAACASDAARTPKAGRGANSQVQLPGAE